MSSSYLTQAELLRDLFLAEDVAGQSAEQSGEERLSSSLRTSYAEKYGIRSHNVIDAEGNVLGESRGAGELMDNHLDREEVQKALQGDSNSLIRRSDTFDVDYCYCAVPVEDSGNFQRRDPVQLIPLQELQDMDDEFVRSTLMAVAILAALILFPGACISGNMSLP